jgi:23S rRNA (cytidine1920-2'-O)/16S rRNA (cytidine1409-2'-O)-methyltransferase
MLLKFVIESNRFMLKIMESHVKAEKKRLDVLVQENGLAESRSLAQKLIMAGKVRVNDNMVIKPSTLCSADDRISLDAGPRFVSRGGEKLSGALEAFGADLPNGKICADVGASTGGFTDCLLQYGAKKVYAIDVGYGNLALRRFEMIRELSRWKRRTP